MTLVNTLAGASFYLAMPVTLYFARVTTLHLTWLVAGAVFAWASLHQHRLHVILARLRTRKGDVRYRLPQGDWFRHLTSPHYTAEILIYTSMVGLVHFADPVLDLVLAFVVTNLATTAVQTHAWYVERFPRDMAAARKWRLVPGCF